MIEHICMSFIMYLQGKIESMVFNFWNVSSIFTFLGYGFIRNVDCLQLVQYDIILGNLMLAT
jgi:hypothetical protein